MQIKFYGHNCYLLSDGTIGVLIDPWLNKMGAFYGSWFQWPINHHLLTDLQNAISDLTEVFLYISHEHGDHFDPATIKNIRSLIKKCIIPDYSDKYLKHELEALNLSVIEVGDNEAYELSDDADIKLLTVDTGVNHDSMAVITLAGELFVNQNDCKIFDRLSILKDVDVDYYSVQFSGATAHPVCYSMDDSEKVRISKKKKLSKLTAIRDAIKLIQPRYYLPAAGPAVFPFLDHSFTLDEDNIFIHQETVAKFLRNSSAKLISLRPGDSFDPERNYPLIERATAGSLELMANKLSCDWYNIENTIVDVAGLLTQVKDRLSQIENIVFEECPIIYFDWGDGGMLIDLNRKSAETTNTLTTLEGNFMRVTACKRYFNLLADSRNRWQEVYLSLRATFDRRPSNFNTFVNLFLFSDISNIRSGFLTTLSIADERMAVVNPSDGKNYEVNRFCPHNGADLSSAEIDDNGRIRCPRHGWLFDINDGGRCLNAEMTLEAKEIEVIRTLCETISVRLTRVNQKN